MTFLARAGSTKAEIYLYEPIGQMWDTGITAKAFQKELDTKAKNATELNIYINSPGGNVFDGIAIFNQIAQHPAKRKIMHVDGLAASIASIILMAGTERRIAKNAMVMIHNPSGFAGGTAGDLRRVADSLDKVRSVLINTYVGITKHKASVIEAWMDDETWMDSKDAKDRGFVDVVTEQEAVEAKFSALQNFAKVPPQLKRHAMSVEARLASMNMKVRQFSGASPAKQ